jgi:hypothetical protein
MSDFFAGVNNARFPEVVMNQGPLPGTGGLPRPLHDTPDGRINYNNTLLGNIEPYAYGKPGYLSSQTAYLNIPHRIQKIVPPLYLPEPAHAESFKLSHPIAEGDVAFVMRLNRKSEVCSGMSNKAAKRAGFETAVDPFINLCTLNYILAGLQICTLVEEVRGKWDQLMHHLDSSRFTGRDDSKYDFTDLVHIVENLIRPFGIVHGKENQGGQSEVDPSSVQWPVSFVASLVLDGKDSDIVNVWHNHNVSAGDDLVFRLKLMPIPPGGKYTLNHYSQGIIEKTYTSTLIDKASANNHLVLDGIVFPSGQKITHVWQLVPDVFSFDMGKEVVDSEGRREFAKNLLHSNMQFMGKKAFQLVGIPWQHVGYWHIARTQVQSKKYGTSEYYYNDMALNLKIGHIDSTFQPVFIAFDMDRASKQKSGEIFLDDFLEGTIEWAQGNPESMQMLVDYGYAAALTTGGHEKRRGVKVVGGKLRATGMMSDAGERRPTPLRLESVFAEPQHQEPQHQEPPRKRQAVARFSVHPSLLAALRGEVPVAAAPEAVEIVVEAGPKASAPLSEDSGVFEPASVGASMDTTEVPTITVAKPSLKAKKPARKGVITSSLLGVDGGVSQEQSRML